MRNMGYRGGVSGQFPRNLNLCILLDRGGEKEALLELCQAFDVTATKTFELVNPVFSLQTCFFSVTIR